MDHTAATGGPLTAAGRTCWPSATWPAAASLPGCRSWTKRRKRRSTPCSGLFLEHGPPLVLKSRQRLGLHRRGDGAASWIAGKFAPSSHRPGRRSTMEVIEAGNGALKTRTHEASGPSGPLSATGPPTTPRRHDAWPTNYTTLTASRKPTPRRVLSHVAADLAGGACGLRPHASSTSKPKNACNKATLWTRTWATWPRQK